jgi:hypothetical protein
MISLSLNVLSKVKGKFLKIFVRGEKTNLPGADGNLSEKIQEK